MRQRVLSVIIICFSIIVGATDVFAQNLGSMDEPPRLRDLEPLLVQMVYLIWALGGIIFTILLMWIGFQYMTSAGDPQKKEELKKKGRNWLIGLVIFFVGYPIVATIYDVLGIGSSNLDCYEQISTPGFHFFFPDICTEPMLGSFAVNSSCDASTATDLPSIRCCHNSIVAPVGENIKVNQNMMIRFDRGADGQCTSCAIAVACSPLTFCQIDGEDCPFTSTTPYNYVYDGSTFIRN